MEQPPSVLRKAMAPFLAVVGPATVMTAGIMGAGSTVALLTAGCWFHYALLWVVFLTLPVIVVCQDTTSRLGAVAGGKGMMKIIADELHLSPGVMVFCVLIPVLLTCVTANIGQLGAMASALANLINLAAGQDLIPPQPGTAVNVAMIIPLAVAALLVSAFGGYKRIEKLLAILICVVLISFLLVAVGAFSHLDQLKLMARGLRPSIPDAIPLSDGKMRHPRESFTAIIGGAIAATAILSFPYFTTEGGYNLANVRAKFRRHVILFGGVKGVYGGSLLIAGAFALFVQKGSAEFNDARQMGPALQSVLGSAGTIFFSIGLFICSFNTLTVVAQLASYFILDCLGRNWRFEKGNRAFLIPFVGFVIVPALLAALWPIPNMLKVIIAMMANCLVSPLAIAVIIYLINKPSLAGEFKASFARNVVLIYSLALVSISGVIAVVVFWGKLFS